MRARYDVKKKTTYLSYPASVHNETFFTKFFLNEIRTLRKSLPNWKDFNFSVEHDNN